MDSKKEFQEIHLEILKKLQNCGDDYEKANLMRLEMGILLNEVKHSKSYVGFLLKERLSLYNELVTNSSINNYSGELKNLLEETSKENFQPSTSTKHIPGANWEPVVNVADINDLMCISNCKGRYEDCENRELTPSNSKELFQSINESLNNKEEKCSVFSLQNESKTNISEQDLNSFTLVSNMFSKPSYEKFNSSSKRNFEVDTTNFHSQRKFSCNNQNKITNYLLSDVKEKQNQFVHKDNDNQQNIVGKNKTSQNVLRSFRNMEDNIQKEQNEEDDKPQYAFRTAFEELHVQNAKKYGNNAEMHQPLFDYGLSKKSLGGRRNVRSNFVPPIIKASEQEVQNGNSSQQDYSQHDDRLKNIDEKMIELIKNEIMHKFKPIDWNDIAGLEYAKGIIKEAVVWPILRPDIFTGLRRPPRGILLFGPPGTGKTLIGKCIASQSKSTFFSISASSLTSKWVGDGEKMVRALFAVAATCEPSVVFIDEIDSLLCQRSENEHESSRRIKTEFLVQLDGASTSEEERILIVGATNRPQELDEAARRRLVRRLYIPLPEFTARLKILKNLMSSVKNLVTSDELNEISKLTDGYSGADMESLCKEASMEPIRSIPPNEIPYFTENQVRPVEFGDFKTALTRVRASVSQNDLKQYIEWDKVYGSGSFT